MISGDWEPTGINPEEEDPIDKVVRETPAYGTTEDELERADEDDILGLMGLVSIVKSLKSGEKMEEYLRPCVQGPYVNWKAEDFEALLKIKEARIKKLLNATAPRSEDTD